MDEKQVGHSPVDNLAARLAETIRSLAAIPRLPTSDGERLAADLIHRRFEAVGCTARVEEVPAYRSYAQPVGLLCAAAAASGFLAGRGGRTVGVLTGAAAAWGIVDDITGGRMLARKMLMRPRATCNVIAEAGDPDAARTLVILVHHDAAPSGVVFSQYLERWLVAHHPRIVASMTSNPPTWWLVIAGPALISLGTLIRSSSLRRVGTGISALCAAALADIAFRPAVPGANDNLSGVAVALAVAAALHTDPLTGLRVLFVSAGAEEALQQGIRGFARCHFGQLQPEQTWFLTLDTVGSGHLLMLEGEGPVRMHAYGAPFKTLVAECARQARVPLLRGLRSRYSTDGSVPHRHGFPTVTLVSIDDQKLIPNYHLKSDTPENVNYRCVEDAVYLTQAIARRLASSPGARCPQATPKLPGNKRGSVPLIAKYMLTHSHLANTPTDAPTQGVTSVAEKPGIGTAETLRTWVRQAEGDAGTRPASAARRTPNSSGRAYEGGC